MIDTDKIKAVVAGFTEGTDMFLVEVKCSVANDIEVVIDSDTAVSIDSCVQLSRAIESEFDRDAEDFELTVASAGIGQPLHMLRQYRKIVGKMVEVVLKSGEKLEGILADATEGGIVLEYQERQLLEGKKRKQLVDVRREIAMTEIKTTKLQISFK